MTRILLAAMSAFVALALGAPSQAQRATQPPRGAEAQIRGGIPGRFDYYALVLSWSPTFCAESPRGATDPQCRRTGRPYSFVLHGLWPQYERGFPDTCPTQDRPFVPDRTIDRMLEVMPSRPLIIHEYRKHGTCSGLGVDQYFDLARKLHDKVRIPQRFASPGSNQMVDTNSVIGDFVAANPGLKPDMLAVACGGPGNRLREVRVCFSREGEFRACGGNELQRRLCNSPRVFVPPVRVGDPDATRRSAPPKTSPLPGPSLAPGARSL